jgi:hypothetical protein
MNALIRRNEQGHFLPGFTSPNPSGRPKGAGAIRELAREYVPAALAKIGALVASPDPRVALAASQEILNRVFGKPLQSIDSEVRKLDIGQLYLAALRRVNGVPEPIDVESTPVLPPDDEPVTADALDAAGEPAW